MVSLRFRPPLLRSRWNAHYGLDRHSQVARGLPGREAGRASWWTASPTAEDRAPVEAVPAYVGAGGERETSRAPFRWTARRGARYKSVRLQWRGSHKSPEPQSRGNRQCERLPSHLLPGVPRENARPAGPDPGASCGARGIVGPGRNVETEPAGPQGAARSGGRKSAALRDGNAHVKSGKGVCSL